jgi:Uncharacterized conserved protein (DUF2045)
MSLSALQILSNLVERKDHFLLSLVSLDAVEETLSNDSFLEESYQLFQTFFLSNGDYDVDDMLYFVKRQPYQPSELFIKRKSFGLIGISEDEKLLVDWNKTLLLNLITHLKYTLILSVCKRDMFVGDSSSEGPIVLSQLCRTVYASPDRTQLEKKGIKYETAYPLIYFMLDDFESTFTNLPLFPNQYICVELFTQIPCDDNIINSNPPLGIRRPGNVHPDEVCLFQGTVSYESLSFVFKNKAKDKVLERRDSSDETHFEFILMRGPEGKGQAQLAIRPSTLMTSSIPREYEEPFFPFASALTYSPDSSSGSRGVLRRVHSILFANDPYKTIASAISKRILNAENDSSQPISDHPGFDCSLTFVNIHWSCIMKDITRKLI